MMDITNKCEKHPSQELVTYCETHKQTCCFICDRTSHRHCKNKLPLADAAAKYTSVDNRTQIKERLQEMRKRLVACKSKRECTLQKFKEHKEIMPVRVSTTRENIIRKVDNLTNIALQDCKQKSGRKIRELSDDIDFCHTVMCDIQQLCGRLDTSEDTVGQLLTMQKSQTFLEKEYTELIDEMLKGAEDDSIESSEGLLKLQDLDNSIGAQNPEPEAKRIKNSTEWKLVWDHSLLFAVIVLISLCCINIFKALLLQTSNCSLVDTLLDTHQTTSLSIPYYSATDLDIFPDGQQLLIIDSERKALIYKNMSDLGTMQTIHVDLVPVSISIRSNTEFILVSLNTVDVYKILNDNKEKLNIVHQQRILTDVTCMSSTVTNSDLYLLCQENMRFYINIFGSEYGQWSQIPLPYDITKPVKLLIDDQKGRLLVEDKQKGFLVINYYGKFLRTLLGDNVWQEDVGVVLGKDRYHLFQRKPSLSLTLQLLRQYISCWIKQTSDSDQMCSVLCPSEVFQSASGVYNSKTKSIVMANQHELFVCKPSQ